MRDTRFELITFRSYDFFNFVLKIHRWNLTRYRCASPPISVVEQVLNCDNASLQVSEPISVMILVTIRIKELYKIGW